MRPLRFTRRQLRHTACVALFAWVFALVSGVANACLLQTAEPGAAAFSLATGAQIAGCDADVAPCEHDAGPAHHHADSGRGEPVQHGGKAVCLKFCADESSALAKSKASQADLPGPVLLAGAPWSLAVQVAAAAQWRPVERPASVGPPLFLRLLRLTI
ncbi:MAG: hypothetical protein Q7U73_06345 [Rubrivivax sp.]|nr:hypothetical protein [Rubrivivax sp.]